MKLTPEESLLLLTCRPYTNHDEDAVISELVKNELDWDHVLWRSEIFRTTPLLAYHLHRLNLQGSFPEYAAVYLENWANLSSLRSKFLFEELISILTAFESRGIKYFLLKGTALSGILYPDPLVRPMLDLDLMILPQDAHRARGTMRDLGYLHALWNPDTNAITPLATNQIAEYQSEHYELPAFMKRVYAKSPVPHQFVPKSWRKKHLKCWVGKDGTLCFPIFVDLHINLSLGFDLVDVWNDVQQEKLFDRTVTVQSATGMLWFIASRLYHEAFHFNTFKLIMFGDLHTILHKRGDAVNWNQLIYVAKKYGMQPPLYYVLTQLRNLTSADVPEHVLTALRPNRLGIPQIHDLGDVMPKLFSHVVVHDVSLSVNHDSTG